MTGDDNEKPADEPTGDGGRAGDSEPVPKLPRGKGLRLNGPEMFRIVITGAMLVAVLVMAKPCGNAVGNFMMGFEGSGKGSAMPKPGNVDLPSLPGSAGDYVELHAGMTDEQVQQAIAAARAKHAAANGSAAGSAAIGAGSPAVGAGSAGSGSAAGSESARSEAGSAASSSR